MQLGDNTTCCPGCGAQQNEYNNVNNNSPFEPCGPEGKSRGVAAILALIIGGLGIHYFYIGKVNAGIYCLLLSLVTCGLWATITFVQGIIFFTMTNSEFEEKFVRTPKAFPIF